MPANGQRSGRVLNCYLRTGSFQENITCSQVQVAVSSVSADESPVAFPGHAWIGSRGVDGGTAGLIEGCACLNPESVVGARHRSGCGS